jgi:hypothetical protein
VSEVFDALQSTLGVLYVNDFNMQGRTFRVQLQAEAPFRARPDQVGAMFVRSATTGEMVPVKPLGDVSEVVGAEPVRLECPICGLQRWADPADLTGDDDEDVCLYCVRDAQAAKREQRKSA